MPNQWSPTVGVLLKFHPHTTLREVSLGWDVYVNTFVRLIEDTGLSLMLTKNATWVVIFYEIVRGLIKDTK